jgi:hypothetical protein
VLRKRKKNTILLFIYLNKVYISKLSFIIILFGRINKNPFLIIYVDLKITTIDKRACPRENGGRLTYELVNRKIG